MGSQFCAGGSSLIDATDRSAPRYISSAVTAKTFYASQACPLNITAQPGQTINVTLLDFAHKDEQVSVGGYSAPQKPPNAIKVLAQKVFSNNFVITLW